MKRRSRLQEWCDRKIAEDPQPGRLVMTYRARWVAFSLAGLYIPALWGIAVATLRLSPLAAGLWGLLVGFCAMSAMVVGIVYIAGYQIVKAEDIGPEEAGS